jgi:dTDP-4-dehydrorhamnose reductase
MTTVLVIGADSLVGSALMQHLPYAVIGTTRRDVSDSFPLFHLDLQDSPTLPDTSIDAAVICAAVTRLQACYENPVESRAVNVIGTGSIMLQLAERGIFTVYLSSDKVFDGSQPQRVPDDAYSPVTEYGRQKADAEMFAQEHHAAILRLSKILTAPNSLFRDWLTALKKGEIIRPFSDMYLAPVLLSTVVSVVSLLIGHRKAGIWQLSGQTDLSYAAVGKQAAALVGADKSCVQPQQKSGVLTENPGFYTSMDITRLRETFGIEPLDVHQVIDVILRKSLS